MFKSILIKKPIIENPYYLTLYHFLSGFTLLDQNVEQDLTTATSFHLGL